MDLLIRYSAVVVSGTLFALGPAWTHVLCLTLFIVATPAPANHRVALCCTYYAVALAPLIAAAYDYSSDISYTVFGYLVAFTINASVVSLSMMAPRSYRWASVVTALVLLSVPPLASYSVVSPLPVAGVLFPGTGTIGLILFLALVAICVTGIKPWLVGLGVLALTFTQSHATQFSSNEIAGINTYRGISDDVEASVLVQFYRHDDLELAVASGADTTVFPESNFGIWHESIASILGATDTIILGGARHYLNNETYVNVLINGANGELHYAQHYPIPLPIAGKAYPVSGRTLATSGRYSVLICNEISNPWQSFKVFSEAKRNQVIWIANFGWTENRYVVNRVKRNAEHWADLYGVSLIQAVNHYA